MEKICRNRKKSLQLLKKVVYLYVVVLTKNLGDMDMWGIKNMDMKFADEAIEAKKFLLSVNYQKPLKYGKLGIIDHSNSDYVAVYLIDSVDGTMASDYDYIGSFTVIPNFNSVQAILNYGNQEQTNISDCVVETKKYCKKLFTEKNKKFFEDSLNW